MSHDIIRAPPSLPPTLPQPTPLLYLKALLAPSPQSALQRDDRREPDGTTGSLFLRSYPHYGKMKPALIVVFALLAETVALPVGKEGQKDVVARCLVEVLTKALSKPDVHLDEECKDILQAGVKYAPENKKTTEGIVTPEDISRAGAPTAKTADVKDIEALLKSVEEKRETPEDERNQESWSLIEKRDGEQEEEVREKRSSWRPGRFHQRKSKRGEEDYDRSQESWGGLERRSDDEEEDGESEEREKRNWRPGRHYQRKSKRDEEDGGEPEEERSQEYWDADKRLENEEEEREKRIWKPTHRYHHKIKLHRRSDEPSEGEGYEDRSQESWDVDKRSWKAGRFHQRRHKRDEEPSEEAREEPEEERSQEHWDVDTGREKREWRAGRYHQRRQKRDEELSEEAKEEPDEERSQEYWDFDTGREKRDWRPGRHSQRRHKREDRLSEDAKEEPDEDRSQEYWEFDTGREKRDWRPGRHSQRRHKRDEEISEEARDEPDEERNQEYWDFDTERDKRSWRPGRHHQRKHKRAEELGEDGRAEPEEERSQEYWDFDKRDDKEDVEVEKRIWKPTHRYHHKRRLHKRGSSEEEMEPRGDSEENTEEEKDRDEALRYLAEKRNPWIYRGYYHPAWYKRDSDEHAATSAKMDELTKLLSYKLNQLANQSTKEEDKRSSQQRELTPQEEKQLENLAAMDMELQKIAAKLHDKTA
ncbi:secretogranin-1 isoform X1 [Xiphophorus maculatus]|uniref:secretogranin-1 isoform X1 n=2 Tax=Xiphophorus maculatus TaxID=8083 RepID=UPI000C6DDD96|nr:secretogranin-1 isoform X1 [Xiphophorus maculatus]